MANNTLNTRIIICNDTTANWGTSTKVLLKGEMGIEFTVSGTPKFKFGDGSKTFAELPYAIMTPEEINQAISSALTASSHTHSNKDVLDALTAEVKGNYDKAYEHSKAKHAPTDAQANVIETVNVNGVALTPNEKTVNVSVPTKTSELTNDSKYVTPDKIKGAGSANVTIDADGNVVVTATDTKYTHPVSGVTAGTYKSVTVDAQGHVTGGTNPNTLAGYGITDAASKQHTHKDADIESIAASKITGVIDIERLPKGALERCVVVADDTARFKLTTEQVQTGDTVKVTTTKMMYFVKDDAKLSTEDGYEPYTAGAATSVPWSGVTGKPDTFKPSAHNHTTSEVTGLDSALAGKATSAQGAKADTAVQSVKIGDKEYKSGTNVVLPAYPTTLPASDVPGWAKAATKPTYTKAEVGLGNVDNTADASKSVASAAKLTSPRSFSITGGATAAAVNFDGTGNVSMNVTKLNASALEIASGDTLILNGGGAS